MARNIRNRNLRKMAASTTPYEKPLNFFYQELNEISQAIDNGKIAGCKMLNTLKHMPGFKKVPEGVKYLAHHAKAKIRGTNKKVDMFEVWIVWGAYNPGSHEEGFFGTNDVFDF